MSMLCLPLLSRFIPPLCFYRTPWKQTRAGRRPGFVLLCAATARHHRGSEKHHTWDLEERRLAPLERDWILKHSQARLAGHPTRRDMSWTRDLPS